MSLFLYNKYFIKICCFLQRKYLQRHAIEPIEMLPYDDIPDSVSKTISSLLLSDSPCMISRFGSVELGCVINYLGVSHPNISRFVYGVGHPWWWVKSVKEEMGNNAGFFPVTDEGLKFFSERILKDVGLIDVLAAWRTEEAFLKNKMGGAKRIRFLLLDPFWSEQPWTIALVGKKILVVHPFVETIQFQYEKRNLLFKKKQILPDFELKTLKAVQTIAGQRDERFKDWFEALEYMKKEVDKIDYDICLIGCGAYGLPLAAHVKRMGKKAVHMGGSLQLLFGIKGRRWEDPNYNDTYNYAQLMNEHWVRPNREEIPIAATDVEGGCYW